MKRIVLYSLLLSFSGYINLSSAQENEGVIFSGLTFEEAIIKAKDSGKKVFVFVSQSWNDQGLRMKKEVFEDEETGRIFKKRYIGIMIDPEASDNSIREFIKKYEITACPVSFFFNAEGMLLEKIHGGKTKTEFLKVLSEKKLDKN